MGLSRLRLRDFQRHKKLDVDLAPGVTTITGPTDSGKSAILRSLRWIATNSPKGSAHVRRGAKKARVFLEVDGREIGRERGSSNTYRVDGKKFAAFGIEPPKEVAELLRTSPECFQGQHDPPFWLSLSAPEAARKLNEIVDLSLVDEVMGKLATEARRTKVELNVVGERLEQARDERRSLEWVADAEGELGRLDGRARALDGLRNKAAAIARLVEEARAFRRRGGRARRGLLEAQRAIAAGEKLHATTGEWKSLWDLCEQHALTKSLRIEPGMQRGLDAAIALGEEWEKRTARANRLGTLMQQVWFLREERDHALDRAKQARMEFEEGMGETCSLCGRPTSEK